MTYYGRTASSKGSGSKNAVANSHQGEDAADTNSAIDQESDLMGMEPPVSSMTMPSAQDFSLDMPLFNYSDQFFAPFLGNSQNSLPESQTSTLAPPWDPVGPVGSQQRSPSSIAPGLVIAPSEYSRINKRDHHRTTSIATGTISFDDSAYETGGLETRASENEPQSVIDIRQRVMDSSQNNRSLQGQHYGYSGQVNDPAMPPPPPSERSLRQRRQPERSPQSSFTCPWPGCGKVKKTRSEFNKHENTHTKPFKCEFDDCEHRIRGFSTVNDLDRHYLKHGINKRGKGPFKCLAGNCKTSHKEFPRKDNFMTHLRAVHQFKTEGDEANIWIEKSNQWYKEKAQETGTYGKRPVGTSDTEVMDPELEVPFQNFNDLGVPFNFEAVGTAAQLHSPISQFYPSQELHHDLAGTSVPEQYPLTQNHPMQYHHTPLHHSQLQESPIRQAGTESSSGLQPNLHPGTPYGRYQNQPNISSNSKPRASAAQQMRRSRSHSQPFHPRAGDSTPGTGPNHDGTHLFVGHAQLSAPSFIADLDQIKQNLRTTEFQDFSASGRQYTPRKVYAQTVANTQELRRLNVEFPSSAPEVPAPGTSLTRKEDFSQMGPFPSNPAVSVPSISVTAADGKRGSSSSAMFDLKEINALIGKFEKFQGPIPEKLVADFRDLCSRLQAFDVQTITGKSVKGRNSGSKIDEEPPKTHFCEWEGCGKDFPSKSRLKKHMMRHTKPLGCGADGCLKHFGSKSDWERHEQRQHIQSLCWKCQLCDEVHYHSLESFVGHLRDHGITDQQRIDFHAENSRLARNFNFRFWCGYCRKIINSNKQGTQGLNYRYSHISDHVIKEDCNRLDWVQLNGMTKGELESLKPNGPSEEDESDEFPEDDELNEDLDDSEPSPTDSSASSLRENLEQDVQMTNAYSQPQQQAIPLSFIHNSSFLQEALAQQDATMKVAGNSPTPQPRTKRHANVVICCKCNNPYNPRLGMTCIDCEHQLCKLCKAIWRNDGTA